MTLRENWTLDPAICHLNHGSFGACPAPVLAAQAELRARMERDAMAFFLRDLEPTLDAAREALAAFIGADPDGLAFVDNATSGVSTVLRSLELRAGDELLTTDHAYAACRKAFEVIAARTGARVVVVDVPFPIARGEVLAEALEAAVTPRTRLALVDHVTSPTALVLPLARIVSALQARGVDVLVDGAHAPGMLDLDLTSIGAAYYTGNCHKWMCAPKGAAFLHVRADRREGMLPLTLSHGAFGCAGPRGRFRDAFDWTGTRDVTNVLAIPTAITFIGGLLPGGWPAVRARNRALALAARAHLAEALGVPLPSPADMIGTMASLPLPDLDTEPNADPLAAALRERHGIVLMCTAWPRPPRRLLRVSAQLYNDEGDYERLAELLRTGVGSPGTELEFAL